MDTLLESQFLRDFIKEFPQGLSTQLQEGASNLSGGQKQKIMVARALLYDPQLMILDESTAEMDGASESAILEYLLRKKEDMINIIVSHRLSTIKICDKLMVLKSGRIIDFGTLEELKKSSEGDNIEDIKKKTEELSSLIQTLSSQAYKQKKDDKKEPEEGQYKEK